MYRGWIRREYIQRMDRRRIYIEDGQEENVYREWIGGEYIEDEQEENIYRGWIGGEYIYREQIGGEYMYREQIGGEYIQGMNRRRIYIEWYMDRRWKGGERKKIHIKTCHLDETPDIIKQGRK